MRESIDKISTLRYYMYRGQGVAQDHSRKLVHALGRGKKSPVLHYNPANGDIMDAATITSLVSNLGFPVVCVGVMFWMQNKEREAHAAESERWTEVVKENTEALRDLKEVVSLLKEKVNYGGTQGE